MLDYAAEVNARVEFIRERLAASGAEGIIFGNSGGKDCALTGILCKMACDNTVGLIMPCQSKQNYTTDREDALALGEKFHIDQRIVDISDLKADAVRIFGEQAELTKDALTNIGPRLRMLTLYTIGAAEHRLVAGTGNRSERYMGYFTKWGDGACDFNPIADLTVTEVYELLRYLGAPAHTIEKAPSAGLFEGQTDEGEMGITYAAIDRFLLTGEASEADRAIIDRYHSRSLHKLSMPPVYREVD